MRNINVRIFFYFKKVFFNDLKSLGYLRNDIAKSLIYKN
ncbi:hypothetical protein SAMN05421841_1068 [Chryseobacterium wanjuense]|uniref:Uncharacterized protein n=1 Tax=Chryseobacterium wanjuense TaxID=356305 RepID=A0A1I0P9Q2_9FLAO|nr:hypothetical protein SAMN05421841_1068 [Chryseobacterium wanjuense]